MKHLQQGEHLEEFQVHVGIQRHELFHYYNKRDMQHLDLFPMYSQLEHQGMELLHQKLF
jgi:hypothetical protein